jgi:Ca2+-binding EF-hand superfamily protein
MLRAATHAGRAEILNARAISRSNAPLESPAAIPPGPRRIKQNNNKQDMKSLVTTLAAFAVAASFSFAADAAKPKPDPEKVFAKKDTNGDKSLSLDEFKAGAKDAAKAEAAFKAKDKDGDGKLSLEEFKAQGGKKKK